MCPFSLFHSHLLSIKKRTFYPRTYCKIPKISTRAYILQRPSSRGLYSKGLCTEGNLCFKIDWASLIQGRNLPFLFVLHCIWGQFPSTSPAGWGGAYIRRSDLTQGFLWYESRGLIFGGAYTWRGLFSKFYSS